ncbi:flagellar biosynthetic protein FliO [Pseudomonas sp. CGJS7]|uniref:flagellar biosynthetic protein FliO n=1 Tax=Pseudomonas sp. CGJS7 TaxID=3109348 RepID=UPI00300ADC44
MPTLPLLSIAVRCCAVLACLPGAALAAAATAAPAKPAAQPPSLFFEFLAILLPVAVALGGLVAVLLYLRKRHGLTAREAPLSILQILPIGPRERIVVLRTRSGRALAVGVGGQSINLIAELDRADVLPADPAPSDTAVAGAPLAADTTVSTATSSTSDAASPVQRES